MTIRDDVPDQNLDRRVNAYRADLAANHLRQVIEAPFYSEGEPARVTASHAHLHQGPDRNSPVDTELVFGDDVTVYDRQGDWAWVQNRRDHYVGYLPVAKLSFALSAPSHKITALSTFAYGKPDIKTPLPGKLYMNSRLHVVACENGFLRLEDGRFIHQQHAATLDELADDFVSVAERYVEVPYLWGGRTSDGIDCSGLVQVACELAGLSCPRDSDMQKSLAGHDLDLGGMEDMQRGDLVFWKGHVAIMVDDTMLLHANARHMKVSIEPFHAVVTRTAIHGDDITAIRRPDALSAITVA